MRLIIMLLIAVPLAGCPKKIVRDSAAFQVETLATLKRQEEAASALFDAADDARRRGDLDACAAYATPALLIDASARAQAYRALWLADLPYPEDDGKLPPRGTKQPDPGPSKAPEPAASICK